MNNKGQGVMHFLIEYGLAILLATIVISVLAIWFRPTTLIAGENISDTQSTFWHNVQQVQIYANLSNTSQLYYRINDTDIWREIK